MSAIAKDSRDVDLLPVRVRAVFRAPLDAEQEARKNRLILQARAHGFSVAAITGPKQTVVLCRKEGR